MKHMIQKAAALLLAAALAAAPAAASFAAGATPSGSDAETVRVYGVESNVTVTAYQIIDAVYDEKGNGLTGYELAEGLTVTIDDLESPSADEITAIAADIYDGTLTALDAITLTYDPDGEYYYADLEAGMWIILVSDSNAVIYNPMIVSNWYTDANLADSLTAGTVSADGSFVEGSWSETEDLADSTYSGEAVYAKSDTVSVDKEITGYSSGDDHAQDNASGADYDIGDTVSFRITTQMPDYTDAYIDSKYTTTFSIQDTLSAGLDAVSKSDISVSVGGTSYSESASTYVLSLSVNTDGSQSIEIAFIESFIAAHGTESIVVEYSTTLNEDANITGDTSADFNYNHVDIEYSNSPSETISTEETGGGDTVYVYTFAITDEIVKVYDSDDAAGSASANGNTVTAVNALAGAEFTIYTDAECENIYTNDQNTAGTTVSTDAGYISFSGLSEGTYYVTETDAPAGYAINDTVYKIVIAGTYDTAEGSTTEGMLTGYGITVTNCQTGTAYTNTYQISYTTVEKTYEASDGETVYTWYEVSAVSVGADQNPAAVTDSALLRLPSTGGSGIWLILIISAGIVLIAAVNAVTKKKNAV